MIEVSNLSQYLCAPRVKQFESVYKIYHYMRKNMKLTPGKVGFDPTYQEIDDRIFEYQYKVM